jgi:hypothetical protein
VNRALAAALAATILLPAGTAAQTMRETTVSRQQQGERELRARINFSAGTLHLVPAPRGLLYRMTLAWDPERFSPVGEWNAPGREVTLGVRSVGGTGLKVSSRHQLEQHAVVELPTDIDVSVDAQVGAVEADLELGGLRLTDATVRTDASRSVVRFSRPNQVACRLLEMSGGATNFVAYDLANSRCEDIRFEGGVGDVTLDLSGEWTIDAQVRVKITLGEVTLLLPRDLGVALTVNRFLASLDAAGFTRADGRYLSPGYEAATRHLNITVSVAVGGLRVDWAD